MDKKVIIFHTIFFITFQFLSLSFGGVNKVGFEELFNVRVNDKDVNFNGKLPTFNENNLSKALKEVNSTANLKKDLIDPSKAYQLIGSLWGSSLHRLDYNNPDNVNLFIGVDYISSRLFIIDSKNKISETKYKTILVWKWNKKFPWIPPGWFKRVKKKVYSYSTSTLKVYGKKGSGNAEFRWPTGITSDRGDQYGEPINLWVADEGNHRIVHLQYSNDGKITWKNTIAGFGKPSEIVYKRDTETPCLYVLDKKYNKITRIPAANENVVSFKNLNGIFTINGFEDDEIGGFIKPRGVCLGYNQEKDGITILKKNIYIADAGRREIYQYVDYSGNIEYIKKIGLPEAEVARNNVAIKSDKFGNLFVFDDANCCVYKYSPNLEYLSKIGKRGNRSSSSDIQFLRVNNGFISGDNLLVTEYWGEETGLQRFIISDIEILSSNLDVLNNMFTFKVDNAFRYRFKIDDSEWTEWSSLQLSGTSQLYLEDEFKNLPKGEHELSIEVQSAFFPMGSQQGIKQKKVKFVIDPEAFKKAQNIQVETFGRRVDVKWEKPVNDNNLVGYIVEINVNNQGWISSELLGTGLRNYRWYASRDDAGKDLKTRVLTKYGDNILFTFLHRAEVIGENALKMFNDGSGSEAIASYEQLEFKDKYGIQFVVDQNVTYLISTIQLSPDVEIMLDFRDDDVMLLKVKWGDMPAPLILFEKPYSANDKIEYGIKHVSNTSYEFYLMVSNDEDNSIQDIGTDITEINMAKFECPGWRSEDEVTYLTNIIEVGINIFTSESITSFFRNVTDITINPVEDPSLQEVLYCIFNSDNIILLPGEHKSLHPITQNPPQDNSAFLKNISIEGESPSNTEITFLGNELVAFLEGIGDVFYSFSNVNINSANPLIILKADNAFHGNISFNMDYCVIKSPDMELMVLSSQYPISANNISFQSNTFIVSNQANFFNLSTMDFTNYSFTFSENFTLLEDGTDCFCLFKESDVNGTFCDYADISNNSFTIPKECSGCINSICTPANNIITVTEPDRQYLNSDYSVTSVIHPAVIWDGSSVQAIRGAVKTIKGVDINDITIPNLYVWPIMIPRSNPVNTEVELEYLPLNGTSQIILSMKESGIIEYANNKDFTSLLSEKMEGIYDKKLLDIKSNDMIYTRGKDDFDVPTKTKVLSFPSNTIFDENDLNSYYGSQNSDDFFDGLTSTDAAIGTISWKIETKPINGNPVNGYENERTITLYEPLPVVFSMESIEFYYKKQYEDQEFKIILEDAKGIEHFIQNTPLNGVRGWYIEENGIGTDWNHIILSFSEEENIPVDGNVLGDKINRLTVYHKSPSAPSDQPSFFLLDNIKFNEMNMEIYNEQISSDFTGTGGSDGWDGIISTNAFLGSNSFKIEIKPGNTNSSDLWTGFTSEDLPILFGKKYLVFAYKKSDPTSKIQLRFEVEDFEDQIITEFAVSELGNPSDMTIPGWSIPIQSNDVWNRVVIDLMMVRDVGNTEYPEDGYYPFGLIKKVTLALSGPPSSFVLFDDIRLATDYINNPLLEESVSSIFSIGINNLGWKIKSLGTDNSQNVIISYGNNNNLGFKVDDCSEGYYGENSTIGDMLSVEKEIGISGTDLENTFLFWQEKGNPFGFIKLMIEASDGKEYPLIFSPYGSLFWDETGAISFDYPINDDPLKPETKYSYKVAGLFNSEYPDLANMSPPVVPQNLSRMIVGYQSKYLIDWYAEGVYNYINFIQDDGTPFILTVNNPIAGKKYGNDIPVEISCSKELQAVDIILYGKNNQIIKQLFQRIHNSGENSFSTTINITEVSESELGDNGEIIVKIKATDIFSNKAEESIQIFIDRTIPTIAIYSPKEGDRLNQKFFLEVGSSMPLNQVKYIISSDGIEIISDILVFSPAESYFKELIDVGNSRPSNAVLELIITTENDFTFSKKINIKFNPLLSMITIGTVLDPIFEWNINFDEIEMCDASPGIGGTNDNLTFCFTEMTGNCEVTAKIKELNYSDDFAKAGIMARTSLDDDAIHGSILLQANNEAHFEYRQVTGGTSSQIPAGTYLPGATWIKLRRIGINLAGYISSDGKWFSKINEINIGSSPLFVGIAHTSHNISQSDCAVFEDLSFENLSDLTGDLLVGIDSKDRLNPFKVSSGFRDFIEDVSTFNANPITMSSTEYQYGIGGQPKENCEYAFLIYNIEQELERFGIQKALSLSGFGGKQDGSEEVNLSIRVSGSLNQPFTDDWINATNNVEEVWQTSGNETNIPINIDLTGIKWLGLFINSNSSCDIAHGVWGNLSLKYSGAEIPVAPLVIKQPLNKIVPEGNSTAFSIKAIGSPPLSYQWQKNYMDIYGATNENYITPLLEMVDDGSVYRCLVTNDVATTESNDAYVSIVEGQEYKLKVEMKDALFTSLYEEKPLIRITNLTDNFNLEGFKIRMWFSREEYPNNNFCILKWHEFLPEIDLTIEYLPSNPNIAYIDIEVPETYVLMPGESTRPEDMAFKFYLEGYCPLDKSNDWTLQGLDDIWKQTQYVAIYDKEGNLIYGEPYSGSYIVFSDDFETDLGWTSNPNGTDGATTGMWERANPQSTSYNCIPYQCGTTTSGCYDLVTGPLAGSSVGEYDIDGGETTIRSPNIVLPNNVSLTLSFKYYFSHMDNATNDDYLRVKIVGSNTTTVLEELGTGSIRGACWTTFNYSLDAFAGQTVYILIEAADGSGGSLIEAGVDDVNIVAEPSVVFKDNFETDLGWTSDPNGTDDATTGMWERANPQSTSYDGIVYQCGTTTSGCYDLVTGPLAGSSVGEYDIDDGVTTIRSPDIELPANVSLTFSFKYYFSHMDNATSDDYLRVKIVGSNTTTVLEELGAEVNRSAAWKTYNYSLDLFAGQTVYILIEAADASGGSLIEAGIDDIIIVTETSVINNSPFGVINTPEENIDIDLGDGVMFSGTGKDPDYNLPLNCLWEFGDGSGIPNSTEEDPGNIQFNYPGIFPVTFTVIDNLGKPDPFPATCTVNVSYSYYVFNDNFETDLGWTSDPNGTDEATTGMWERANPQSTSYDCVPYQCGTTTSGCYDLVTGPLAGTSVGEYDIDDGVTTIRSPDIELPANMTLSLSFKYYFSHMDNATSDDYLRVKVVGSNTTTVLEELGAGSIRGACWMTFNYSLDAFAGQTVYILIEAADASGGSLIEAGIDDVNIVASQP